MVLHENVWHTCAKSLLDDNCDFWGKLCPPNPPIGSGDRVQTRLIFTVFIVWWPLIIPMIQYIKFGRNPSFDSRDSWQTSLFLSKFDIQSTGVTLKMRSRSPKSNHFFPMSQWCFYASLVKIHQLVQEIECRQGSRVQTRLIFTTFIVWWPWKLGQGHQTLIKSLNHPNVTIYEVWPESVIWFKRYGADKLFLVKIWNFKKVFIVWWPWKLGQGLQKLIQS